MTGRVYFKKPTQEDRILDLLKERGDRGAYVYEFTSVEFMRPFGGAIMQYNARLFGLRKKFNCICHKSTRCLASKHIINTTPGHFIYKETSFDYKFLENGQGAFV